MEILGQRRWRWRWKCNSCDGIYRSMDVHFTGECDNRCSFCIDAQNRSPKRSPPNVAEIVATIVSQQEKFDDVLFLGGEPCLYLSELIECVSQIKRETKLRVYVTTSVPYRCYQERDRFLELIEIIDGLNISAQHYDERIGDAIRGTTSKYDRQKFYAELPDEAKKKIRVTVNLVYPYFSEKEEILKLLHHYDKIGFGSILIRELQHAPRDFVSFEKTMGMKLPSAYSHGCQSSIKIPNEQFSTPIILKRSCPLVEETAKATFADVFKVFLKLIFKPKPGNFAVVWESGELKKGW